MNATSYFTFYEKRLPLAPCVYFCRMCHAYEAPEMDFYTLAHTIRKGFSPSSTVHTYVRGKGPLERQGATFKKPFYTLYCTLQYI